MPCHHAQHVRNVGPILFVCNENIAHIMPRVTACAVMSCAHLIARAPRQAMCPKLYMACQKLLMDMPFAQAKLYLSKIITSHFSTLNMKIANQNVLKRILIAMLNENMAVLNENFRIRSEESVPPLYKW